MSLEGFNSNEAEFGNAGEQDLINSDWETVAGLGDDLLDIGRGAIDQGLERVQAEAVRQFENRIKDPILERLDEISDVTIGEAGSELAERVRDLMPVIESTFELLIDKAEEHGPTVLRHFAGLFVAMTGVSSVDTAIDRFPEDMRDELHQFVDLCAEAIELVDRIDDFIE